MQQKCLVNIAIEKGFKISQVQDWVNEKITNSKVTKIKLYNTELIFDGSFDTFLGDIDVFSAEGISKAELNELFRLRPYFIHQFFIKNFKSTNGGIFMTKKNSLTAVAKRPHIIDETELNQLIANFSKKNITSNTSKKHDKFSSSNDLDNDEYNVKHSKAKLSQSVLPPSKVQ
jgi:hypothetical protein